MKKHFNIKKISMVLFTFICMFLLTNNVKAGEKYVCNYSVGAIQKAVVIPQNYYEGFELRLIYDNGNYSIGTYKNGKFYSSTDSKKSRKNGFFVGSLDEIEEADAPLSISDGILNRFKGYDILKEKKCPAKLYFSAEVDPEGSGGFLIYHYIKNDTGYDIDGGECNGLLDCGVVTLNNNTSEQSSSQETDDNDQTTENYQTCSYADIANYTASKDTSKDFTISFNEDNVYVTIDNTEAITWELYANFTAKELNGECPNVLFMSENGGGATPLNLKKESGISYYRYGLIVELNESTNQNRENDICNGKTMDFVKIVYNLIRFLLPIIVIVFSVIDFVGVVLSGETEKMEKAKKRFVIRLLVAAAILFVPAIIELLLKLAGIIDSGAGLVEFTCNLFN